MTTNTVALTPAEQAIEVQRIAAMRGRNSRLIRCDGTLEELRSYRANDLPLGWDLGVPPEPLDLLLSTVVISQTRMIVSLCRVEDVVENDAMWDPETDVSIKPAVDWRTVMAMAGRPARAWGCLTQEDSAPVLRALSKILTNTEDVTEEEGETERRSCRTHSMANRAKMLERADGLCVGCGENFRERFGTRGDRTLDVHHRVPMSARGPGVLETRLSDLVVLCATCHRLIHADRELSLERVQAGWRGQTPLLDP